MARVATLVVVAFLAGPAALLGRLGAENPAVDNDRTMLFGAELNVKVY